jgi:putative endonuclease
MAVEFLLEQGWKILARNYRYHRVEIDIIGEDGTELVFVEVKARHSTLFGEPEESVTPRKEEHIRRAAAGFCLEHGMTNRFYRFDIIAVRFMPGSTVLKHLRQAF